MSYLKEAQLLAHNARKLLHRKRDLLSDVAISDLQTGIDRLDMAARTKDEVAVKEAADHLDKEFGRVSPHRQDAGWRENCEVLLVAFVLAIAIRAYFLQPFKIPTGSMQPTLNGITGHPMAADQTLPGFVGKTFQFMLQGRTYLNAVSEVDDEVVGIKPETHFYFFKYSRIHCASGRSYLVQAPEDTLTHPLDHDGFAVRPHHRYRAGEVIARGYVDTGDQVFVDKFTYHFRPPRRGDVFVFNTAGIAGIQMNDPDVKSQFYIKRLAAVSGDNLRIEQPRLFVNGALANAPGFARVMTARDGYHGYSNDVRFNFLTTPEERFTVPPKSYFAMGDNSFYSSDSRAWGRVPAENVVGRGLFVYYPFTSHWGVIR